MPNLATPRIVSLEKMEDGLFLYFADGRNAFFPTDLLYSALRFVETNSADPADSRIAQEGDEHPD